MDQGFEYREQTLPRRTWIRGKIPPLIRHIRAILSCGLGYAMRDWSEDVRIPLVSRFEEKDIFARYETNIELIWNRKCGVAAIEMRQSIRWKREERVAETRIRTTADPESFVYALLLDFESLQFHGTIPNYAAPIPMIWEMESSLRAYAELIGGAGQTQNRKRRRDEMEGWRLIRPYT